jgi:hypothetical protein
VEMSVGIGQFEQVGQHAVIIQAKRLAVIMAA